MNLLPFKKNLAENIFYFHFHVITNKLSLPLQRKLEMRIIYILKKYYA